MENTEPWNEFTNRTCSLCGQVLPKKSESVLLPKCKDFGYICINWEDLKNKFGGQYEKLQ